MQTAVLANFGTLCTADFRASDLSTAAAKRLTSVRFSQFAAEF